MTQKVRRWLGLFCAGCMAVMCIAGSACAERSFRQDMQNMGDALAESFAAFGEQIGAFSSNPYDYIENNETFQNIVDKGWQALEELETYLTSDEFDSFMKYIFAAATEQIAKVDLKAIKEMAWDTGEAFAEHWPVFKSSVKSAVEAVLNSDLPWEEKKEELRKYGILAIPYLAEVDFEAAGDNAKAALATLRDLIPADTDEQVKAWLSENKQRVQDLREYLES